MSPDVYVERAIVIVFNKLDSFVKQSGITSARTSVTARAFVKFVDAIDASFCRTDMPFAKMAGRIAALFKKLGYGLIRLALRRRVRNRRP